MIDRILLFPSTLTLALRNAWYKGGRHSVRADVPTLCVGNLSAGGTGKTPLTEYIVRTLLAEEEGASRRIAVLSRGYRRRSRGFQSVPLDGSARFYGDEPVQIASKFPQVSVAVDRNRVEGCRRLTEGDGAAGVIVLDDAFQYRRLSCDLNILLMDYGRPVFKDRLLPLGRLRDLPSRVGDADVIVVTKCPSWLDEWEKGKWAAALGLSGFSTSSCKGRRRDGREQTLLFSMLEYDALAPVFPEGDARYTYAQRLILFSGIADDAPLRRHLSDKYKLVKIFRFGDHHRFTRCDIRRIDSASKASPTAIVATTEKDACRLADVKKIPERLRERIFRVPVRIRFLTPEEEGVFAATLRAALQR